MQAEAGPQTEELDYLFSQPKQNDKPFEQQESGHNEDKVIVERFYTRLPDFNILNTVGKKHCSLPFCNYLNIGISESFLHCECLIFAKTTNSFAICPKTRL